MDHTQAIQEGFAERYLLLELTPAQRDQFEEHFFECPICSADVQSGAAFIDNARAVLGTNPEPVPAPHMFAKFGLPFQSTAFLTVCLAILVAYQNIITIPAMRSGSSAGASAELVAAVSLIGMGSRDASRPVIIPHGRDIVLSLDVPSSSDFTSYSFQVQDSRNQVRVNLPIPAEKAKDSVILSIPGSDLPPGRYEIMIVGKRSSGAVQELSRVPAAVK